VLTYLRSATPELSKAAIDAELASLEAAIQRVELEFESPLERPRSVHAVGRPVERPWYRRRAAGLAAAGVAVLLIGGAGFTYYTYTSRIPSPAQPTEVPLPARADAQRTREAQSADAPLPYIFMRQLVPYRTTHPTGTIIIDKSQLYLYVTQPKAAAVRYGIALGNNCADTAGLYQVSRRLEPGDRLQQERGAAEHDNTAGDRALYLGSELHLIHGTNATRSIGRTVWSGCFQIIHRDFADLFNRVEVGTRVVVN